MSVVLTLISYHNNQLIQCIFAQIQILTCSSEHMVKNGKTSSKTTGAQIPIDGGNERVI